MKKLDSQLRAWRELPVSRIPLSDLRLHAGFQARALDVAPARDRARLEDASDHQLARLRASLLFNDAELEPLLVARIDGELFVVDGHHRLGAYRLACRADAPARVLTTTLNAAVMASKLANCGGELLPMHPDQYRDAAWQYLAQVTNRGLLPLPRGASCRSVAARFGGISPDTVSRMIRALPGVDVSTFGEAARDPATGWPRWRHVRGNAWRDCMADVPSLDRVRQEAERLAKRLGALRDKASPVAFRMAIEQLVADEKDGAQDSNDLLTQWLDRDADY